MPVVFWGADIFSVSEEPFSYLQKAGSFPMTQNRALQLLYDLRYLNVILTVKSEEAKTSRIKHDSRCSVILSAGDLQHVVEPHSCLNLQPCCLPEHPQEPCLRRAGQYNLCAQSQELASSNESQLILYV